MFSRIVFLVPFVVLLSIPEIDNHGFSIAQDGISGRERFLAEAPLAWEKYGTRARRFQGSIERITIQLAPKKEVMKRDRCELKQRDGCSLFLVQGLVDGSPPNTEGLVMGINDRYGFELRRQTPTAPWTVVQIDGDLSNGMKFGLGSPPDEAVIYWSTCPTTLALIPYFSWGGIKDPNFTLNKVTSVTRNERQAVKVEFAYRSPADKPRIPSLNGWVLYDPQRFWVIHEYNVQVEWTSSGVKASTVATYEYEVTADGLPIPKQVIQRFTPVGGVDRESRFEFDLKESNVPENDFTLSAFGLPEPTSIHRPIPWYLWAALAGGICLSLAVLFRWLARRTKTAVERGL